MALKYWSSVVAGAAVAAVCTSVFMAAFAGPLDPPAGPVAPTYKTLGEVEPRVAVNATNTPGDADATPSVYKITTSGSYYLVGNVFGPVDKIAIEIAASNVTLDLNGFQVWGIGATGGIKVTLASRKNITIRNGHVQGMSGPGISLITTGTVASNCRVEDVTVFNCTGTGIEAGEHATIVNCKVEDCSNGIFALRSALIRDCSARSCSSAGIFVQEGTIEGCTSTDNGTAGIFISERASVQNCTAARNGTAGIQAGSGSVITACSAANNTQNGITASGGSVTVADCSATGNGSNGISLSSGTIRSCIASSNTLSGIVATGRAVVDGCTAASNLASGISIAGGSITGCIASSNSATGLAATSGVITQSEAMSNGTGISVGTGTLVTHCRAGFSGGNGIHVAASNCLIQGNLCTQNGTAASGAGIFTNGEANRIEGNNLVYNDWGLDCDGAVNLIINNTARGNPNSNYDIFTGNRVGTVLVPPLSGDISGNTGGAGLGTNEPWANFAY
ncbi:MAG: right-handed parallel beta-helix repeat-containing protein [Phycisphaerales bacterium]|nr:right-handed parallel beta-helix repeat-containing protein [Phycisphaerales bacterium]